MNRKVRVKGKLGHLFILTVNLNLSFVARGHFKFKLFLVQEEGISLVFGVESRRLSRVTPKIFDFFNVYRSMMKNGQRKSRQRNFAGTTRSGWK